ncbi:MAG TPA: ABC transporter permease [Gemmatimonadaceae bacterium]|nr:ABC transporter permease [Gemmatimonadaceae bacterium]
MSLWRQLSRGVRALTHRSDTDRELADEVQHYLDQTVAAKVKSGLSAEEARREARLEMGSPTAVTEEARGYGWENLVESAFADLSYAARRLWHSPGFTAVTVLTLAVGTGATTAIFSAVNPILFQPLPYPDPSRIVMIWESYNSGGRLDGTFAMYRELSDRSRSLSALAVSKPWQPTMLGRAEPERLEGQRVSVEYFRILGVSPAVGRSFEPSDDRFNGPKVVILSDALWRRRFGADPAVVGRVATLDDDSYLVIGVMPRGFENVLVPTAELWAPLQYDMSHGWSWGHHLRTIARLAPGVSVAAAEREVGTIGRAFVLQHPEAYGPSCRLSIVRLQEDLTRAVRPALLAILGAAVLVLLIACVNVTNLLLARGVQRRGEFALRAALGAGRRRLVRQMLTESLVLAVLGGALGVEVAMLGVRALVALSPPGLPRASAIDVDGSVFAFAIAITTMVGLAFGLLPALDAAGGDPGRALQHDSPRTVGGRRRTRATLVVAEVALALVLLVSSGLLLRSLERLFAVEPGFDPSRLLTMQVQLASHRFDNDTAAEQFFAQALEAVRRVPGVTSAALTSQLPMSGDVDEYGVHFAMSPTKVVEGGSTYRYAVSPGYLETMHIPLRRGRWFDDHDVAGAPLVAVLSDSYARRIFGGADPSGQRLRIGPPDGPPFTIVGVVADVKQLSLAVTGSDAIYIPESQWLFPDRVMSVVVRAHGDIAALAPSIRQAVWSVDKDQPVVRLSTMDDLVAASAAERRFVLILFEAFALAALVLAAAGIYGVLSGNVAERTREIGVRTALGATRPMILGLVLREGFTLSALGAAIGLAGAAAATQALAAMLFGVSRLDPVTYVAVIALLAAVAAIASVVPAWRATRVDPASTLRTD